MRSSVLLFLLGMLTVSVKAQDSLPVRDSLTIEQAIATALQNNYDIFLARNDSAVAAIDYSYRDAALLPRVNGTSAILLNNNAQNITLADGTKRNRTGITSKNVNASVGLNWVVFDGLKMFVTRTKAGEYVKLGSLIIKQQVNNTVADVVNNYYNIVRHKQQLKAVEEQMAVSEDRYNLAKYRFEIGVGIKPDVLQAQIDLNAQKAARLNELTLIEQLKQELNRLMNIAPDNRYNVSDSIPIQTNLVLGDLQSNLEETNAQLRVARKNVDIAQLTIKERRADRLPVVSFNSAYNFSQVDNNSVVNPTQPLFSQNRGLNYGLSASIPIFNNFNTRRLIRQAELSATYQQLVYDNQKAIITTGLYNAYSTFNLQKQALALEESNIELVKENLFIARERYRLAASTFLELREAQRSLEDAYTRLINARYNMKVAETELLRLKGSFVTQ